MDSNINTQHMLLCTTFAIKSIKIKSLNHKRLQESKASTCTVIVVRDMGEVFDTVNIHKLTLANIPSIIIKFIANYIKG